ncbi:MAG: carbohydrate ABC transporter permease [Spirochaetaceae bacterium]|nr:MAG: carbohydrate ABC transporter permease [Spirochaetaceae bacterium]
MSNSTQTILLREDVQARLRAKRRRDLRGSIVFHSFVILFGFLMLYPLLWLAGSSFKPSGEIFTNLGAIIPSEPTLMNFVNGWRGFGGITFTTFYQNSFLYAGIGTFAAVLSSVVVAYGFARLKFPLRGFWFTCMLMTLMMPVQIQIIPQYIFFSQLGMINTFWPLLLPRFLGQAGQAFFIFMIVQFIRGIPIQLDEAAEIDGANKVTFFLRVMLPLVKPAMVTAGIFSFYWTWSDFLTPLIYLNRPRLYTVSVALRAFSDPAGATDWGAIYAMSFLSLVPVLVIFVLFQKHIVEGISTTGLK